MYMFSSSHKVLHNLQEIVSHVCKNVSMITTNSKFNQKISAQFENQASDVCKA